MGWYLSYDGSPGASLFSIFIFLSFSPCCATYVFSLPYGCYTNKEIIPKFSFLWRPVDGHGHARLMQGTAGRRAICFVSGRDMYGKPAAVKPLAAHPRQVTPKRLDAMDPWGTEVWGAGGGSDK